MRRTIPLPGILRYLPVRLAIFACIYVAAHVLYFTLKWSQETYLAFNDAFLYIGLIYLIIGMGLYIHNIGLFKTFRYWAYRAGAASKIKREGAYDAKPMDLVAFTQYIMAQPKKPTAPYLLFGTGLLMTAVIMTLLHGVI